MKNTIKKMSLVALLVGILAGCGPERRQESNEPEPILRTRTEKLDRISWNVLDTNGDGKYEELITPHRNSYYGTNGPVYSLGRRDLSGEGQTALDFAKFVITYKNEFSKMAGDDRTIYWLCRVDDFNGDGKADRISWPRLGDKMPVFDRPSMTSEMKEKADQVIIYENYILDYIINRTTYYDISLF